MEIDGLYSAGLDLFTAFSASTLSLQTLYYVSYELIMSYGFR